MTLPTIIAELEEAERAATSGPWQQMAGDPLAVDAHSAVYVAKMTGATPVTELAANARLIALMRTHLPTLIEAVKRQGEALEKIADPATYSHNLPSCCQHTFDDTCELFSDIARAAQGDH